MRFVALVSWIGLASCAARAPISPAVAPPPAPRPAPPPAHTAVDHADLAVDLPGTWTEHRLDDGYDLRRGDEQLIIGLYPLVDGDSDGNRAITVMAESQHAALAVCKGDLVVRPPDRDHELASGEAVWTFATCSEPATVIVYVAAAAAGRAISYEHYRYKTTHMTREMEQEDATIFASLHVKPATTTQP
jgi:hypothetical protein